MVVSIASGDHVGASSVVKRGQLLYVSQDLVRLEGAFSLSLRIFCWSPVSRWALCSRLDMKYSVESV